MIDLYTCDTPNGKKVSIALEECGFVYNIHKVDIRKGEQHQPVYRKINPNQKIPAIVDHKGPAEKSIRVFETGAILQYLAGKSGRFFGNEEETGGAELGKDNQVDTFADWKNSKVTEMERRKEADDYEVGGRMEE